MAIQKGECFQSSEWLKITVSYMAIRSSSDDAWTALSDYRCKLFKEQLLYANLETLDC